MSDLKNLRDLSEERVEGPPAVIAEVDALFPISGDGEKLVVIAVNGTKLSAYVSRDMSSVEAFGILALVQRNAVVW